MNAKQQLINQLKSQGAFSSYSKQGLSNIPDTVLIEETLRMGDVPEYIRLFKIFPIEKIKQVWNEKMLPDRESIRTIITWQ